MEVDARGHAFSRRRTHQGGPADNGRGRVLPDSLESELEDAVGKFLREHAISPEVAGGRGYFRYTPDDDAAVKEAYASLNRYQRATTTRWAHQEPGIIFWHHAAPGCAHVYAQMRPENPIRTGPPVWHYHPTVPPAKDAVIVYPPEAGPKLAGRPLNKRRIYSAKSMATHITRRHDGVNREDVHSYIPMAKYVFPPGPTKKLTWTDEQGHLRSRAVKDTSVSLAKRLDVHPMALPLIESADRVFYVIEGAIKADAILSQGEAVFSVPSVTLWDPPELAAFAKRYLRQKTVVIVPDMDWHENALVYTQAMLARSFLLALGVERVCIAAPPKEAGQKGVDDFLLAGGDLDDLAVIGRLPQPRQVYWQAVSFRRGDQALRDARVLERLALHAGADGTFAGSLTKLARTLEMNPRAARRAVASLIDSGVIALSAGSLEIHSGFWRGRYFNTGEDWIDRPMIVIPPELRAVDVEPEPLGRWIKWLSNPVLHRTLKHLRRRIQASLEALEEAS
jgi:hypothetical protein